MSSSSSHMGYEQLGSQGMQASGGGGTSLPAKTGGNLIYPSTLNPTFPSALPLSFFSPCFSFKMGQVAVVATVYLLSLMRFSCKSGGCVVLAGLLACIIHYFIVLGRDLFSEMWFIFSRGFPCLTGKSSAFAAQFAEAISPNTWAGGRERKCHIS